MESGYLFYQDLQWIPLRGLMIASRTTVYSTDSYAARLYEVEQDLQGASSLVSLWGSGIRANLVLKYSPKRGYGLSLKWTRTFSESTLPMGETSGSFTAQADIIW